MEGLSSRDYSWMFMQSGTETLNLKNQDTILNVTFGVLHFVGDSLVPDTIDITAWKFVGAKVLQQVDKKFISIVTTLAIIDQMSEFGWKNCMRRSCLKLVTNYYTTMLTTFEAGVGSLIFILKLLDHLPGSVYFGH